MPSLWGLRSVKSGQTIKKAARLGDTVIPRITPAGQGQWTVALVNETGELYAAVWLGGQEQPGQ